MNLLLSSSLHFMDYYEKSLSSNSNETLFWAADSDELKHVWLAIMFRRSKPQGKH